MTLRFGIRIVCRAPATRSTLRNWSRRCARPECLTRARLLRARAAAVTRPPPPQAENQKALYEASRKVGIVVKFGVRTEKVEPQDDGRVQVTFADGTQRMAQMVFGADGVKNAFI